MKSLVATFAIAAAFLSIEASAKSTAQIYDDAQTQQLEAEINARQAQNMARKTAHANQVITDAGYGPGPFHYEWDNFSSRSFWVSETLICRIETTCHKDLDYNDGTCLDDGSLRYEVSCAQKPTASKPSSKRRR